MLYVSYNIFACIAILAITGGFIGCAKKAAKGGILGGVILGALMLLMSLALFSHIEVIANAPMPTLALANQISPTIALGLSVIIFLMIFNTLVGVLYSFTSRFVTPNTQGFRIASLIFGLLAYFGSQFGFVELVGLVYPIFGYIGFVVIAAIAWAWVKQRKAGFSLSSISDSSATKPSVTESVAKNSAPAESNGD